VTAASFTGRANFHLFQQGVLGCRPRPAPQQIDDLGQYKRGPEKRTIALCQRLRTLAVLPLAAVDRGRQAAGVEKNQDSPKSTIASSTLSAKVG
jgi:hypothetical protein